MADMAGHHFGRIERPGLFQALVADWLERMEATLVPEVP
jgi:hypothetical protein